MDFLNRFLEQAKSFYNQLKRPQKMALGVLALLVVVVLIGLVISSARSPYVLLYSNLDRKGVQQVQEKLKAMNIPFQLKRASVYVPEKEVHRTRLLLANEGLLKGSVVGYEIFDRSTFATSDYVQHLNFQRALEGELARTISSIQSIRQARVHLVLPKPTLFTDQSEPASASVVLSLTEPEMLDRKTAHAIVNLVASSVEGLSPSRVTLLDTQGNLLASGQADRELSGLSDTQLELQKTTEKYIEEKILSLLGQVLGSGKCVVRVNVLLDFDKIDRTEERFDPQSQVLRSEDRYEKGTPGQAGSISKRVVQFEISKTVAHIVSSQGGIKRMTVAAVIDGTYETKKTARGVEKQYTPRTPQEMETFRKLITRAAGLDSKRGDELEVTNIPFDSSGSVLEESSPFRLAGILPPSFVLGLKIVGGILLVLACFVLVYRLLQPNPVSTKKTARATPSQTVSSLEAEIRQMAEKDPSRVAKMISEWVSGSKEKGK